MLHKPVLITGGAGFIGGHLLRHLSKLEISTIAIDDLSAGSLANLPEDRTYCEFIEGDVGNDELMAELIGRSQMVIHFAAVVGMQNVLANPMRTIRTNVEAVCKLAEHCCRVGVPLVDISSSAVYHSPSLHESDNFSESDVVHGMGMHPVSTYSESKSLGELICDSFRRSRGLKCLIVRPFNLIGPGQSSEYGMVVPRFVRLALAGEPLPIYGDGKQTRTFSDVRQAVKLLWSAVCRNNWQGEVLNLATNSDAISILDLAELVSRIGGKPPRLTFIRHEQVFGPGMIDVYSRRPNLDRLRGLIGSWQPVALQETIGAVFEYEQSQLHDRLEIEIEA